MLSYYYYYLSFFVLLLPDGEEPGLADNVVSSAVST